MARRAPANRIRTVITPEGAALPFLLATRGARAAALLIECRGRDAEALQASIDEVCIMCVGWS